LLFGVTPWFGHEKTAVAHTAAHTGGSLARYGIMFFMAVYPSCSLKWA